MPTTGQLLEVRLEKSETAGIEPTRGMLLHAGINSYIQPTNGQLLSLVIESIEGPALTRGLLLDAHAEAIFVAPAIISRGYLLSAKLITAEQEMLNPIVAQTKAAGALVTISATVSSGAQPSSWIFNQIAGATVTISGTGSTRTFVTPKTVVGDSVRISVTALRDGVYATPVEAVVHVYPHDLWKKVDGGWVPIG